jgi:hypothetical protein
MKQLDIVFTKSKKKFPLLSWGIMLWTGKAYSHVARAIQIRDWGKRYYHASEGKVNYEYEKFFHQKHKIIKEYNILIPDELDKEIKKACYEEAGNTYATMQNVGIALTDIYYKIFHIKKENPWKRGRNCSEILYAKCFKIMIPELDFDENKIKPHQVEEIILKYFEKDEAGYWKLKIES